MNTKIRRNDYGSTFMTGDMLDALALMGISLALLVAFYYQLAFDELPCPLCLLQRAGLILVGIGFAMNVRYGVRSMHYGFVLVSAVVTGIIAGRQVLLHITPGSVAYGSALWGLHFYTWCVIASVLIVLFVAGLLVLRSAKKSARPASMSLFGRIAMAIFAFVTIANLISTLLECGGGQCADDPVQYELLDRFRNT
ncbi:disulfide bond formation protein B [Burkholderia sp. BE17]|uniref:disulfide bond formation protein B n=1 Tax=Burkholderia sp. BE17 TaxID=2656644 RepID=UPI00128BDEED|nr:disulfide bond formation protein B [Burkholderia sp. BE17]MPV70220.1 disulfide bond formation protein B [Burkholderia sp. BE17]